MLIALGLEGCVERVHQHHLRDEADRNLVQEIQHNKRAVETTRTAAAKELKDLQAVMKFLEGETRSPVSTGSRLSSQAGP